jgi:hypothetical protein
MNSAERIFMDLYRKVKKAEIRVEKKAKAKSVARFLLSALVRCLLPAD